MIGNAISFIFSLIIVFFNSVALIFRLLIGAVKWFFGMARYHLFK